jgi:chemotaxis family two-component system response regulator Rcp1
MNSLASMEREHPIDILIVDDNPGDVRLAREALIEGKIRNNLHVARDGIEALAMLRSVDGNGRSLRPDLILVDLNMPRMDGRQLLAVLKSDDAFRRIPVVVMTSSRAEEDVVRSYDLHANCFITKPVDLDQMIGIVQKIEAFWIEVVTLSPE